MEQPILDIISVDQANTLYGLFCQRVNRTPDSLAYRSYSKSQQAWYDTSWYEMAQYVAQWQQALASEQLHPGDRVALNLKNSKEWAIFDQAAMGLGLVVVPLYPDDRPDNVAYILKDADVKLLFLQTVAQWKRLMPSITDEHSLSRIIINNSDNDILDDHVCYLDQWLTETNAELKPITGDAHQLASIIYTSGTTGRPKGVMLSHHNMLSVAAGSLNYIEVYTDDLFLSFLPLSHTLERTAGYYLPMMAGASVAYSRGIPQLAEDMLQLSPTAMFTVPRIFERISNRIHQKLAEKSILAQLLFKITVHIGWQRFLYQQGRGSRTLSMLLWPFLDKKIARKLRLLFGQNMRVMITGGAALPPSVAKLFISIGINLVQGYGLTETSPVISVNEPDNNYPESVGRPLSGVDVKIGDNDELLCKGIGNMLGYWNNHKATAQTIDSDGWLHTGDQARIGDSGHIYITGRIKDILVLSNGEKVPPTDIESAILQANLFDQALVVGEGQSYLSALIVVNSDLWFSLAKEHNLDGFDHASLKDKKLHQHVVQQLRQLLHNFPAYAKIRKVILSLEPWTAENNLMTPTMKLKRSEISAHFKNEIEELYSE